MGFTKKLTAIVLGATLGAATPQTVQAQQPTGGYSSTATQNDVRVVTDGSGLYKPAAKRKDDLLYRVTKLANTKRPSGRTLVSDAFDTELPAWYRWFSMGCAYAGNKSGAMGAARKRLKSQNGWDRVFAANYLSLGRDAKKLPGSSLDALATAIEDDNALVAGMAAMGVNYRLDAVVEEIDGVPNPHVNKSQLRVKRKLATKYGDKILDHLVRNALDKKRYIERNGDGDTIEYHGHDHDVLRLTTGVLALRGLGLEDSVSTILEHYAGRTNGLSTEERQALAMKIAHARTVLRGNSQLPQYVTDNKYAWSKHEDAFGHARLQVAARVGKKFSPKTLGSLVSSVGIEGTQADITTFKKAVAEDPHTALGYLLFAPQVTLSGEEKPIGVTTRPINGTDPESHASMTFFNGGVSRTSVARGLAYLARNNVIVGSAEHARAKTQKGDGRLNTHSLYTVGVVPELYALIEAARVQHPRDFSKATDVVARELAAQRWK